MFEPQSESFATTAQPAHPTDAIIGRFLRAARTHLDLQVAYVSEIVGNESIFRHVDAPGLESLVKPGDRRSLDDVYCRHILEGRIPELMPDTAAVPLAAGMPITAAIPIGAHVSVPVRLPGGDVYGMFCCLGPQDDPTLNQRDLNMLRTFADLAAHEIERERRSMDSLSALRAPIEALLAARAIDIVYQPIFKIGQPRPIGFESLSRFAPAPIRPPDQWFADAAAAGLGLELELLAIERALEALAHLPADIYLTVNASPSTACHPALQALLGRHALSRIVLEITEHEGVEDVTLLQAALAGLRAAGLRLAIDDAGAGYSGLQQILHLRPDIIKLDRFFVRDIEKDPTRRALAAALANFAGDVGSVLVAEGVEAEAELTALQALGFNTIQGYFLGRPAPLASAITLTG